jgi:hypothetical protein
VLAATWKAPHGNGYAAAIAKVVDDVALYDLVALAANDKASTEVRAIAALKLHDFKGWLSSAGVPDPAQAFYALQQIEQFEKDPKRLDLAAPAQPPDGPPIGSIGDSDDEWLPN